MSSRAPISVAAKPVRAGVSVVVASAPIPNGARRRLMKVGASPGGRRCLSDQRLRLSSTLVKGDGIER